MSRLREVQVHTKVNSLHELLHSDIPIHDSLEFSKYIEDCHSLLYKLLQAEKIRNPHTRSQFVNVNIDKLLLLRAAWENYLFDYYSSLTEIVIIGKRGFTLLTLFWRNVCVLNAVILKRKYRDDFPYVSARVMKYARTNLLCVSHKKIGDYRMSELLAAMRTISLRKWSLPWNEAYINYLVQLEFVASERITWLGGEEDADYYDEGCTRAKDSNRHGVTLEITAFMTEWFLSQKKRTRNRMRLQKWLCTEKLQIDQLAVIRLHKMMREKGSTVHDVSRFLRPLKNFILQNCLREGEDQKYMRDHGSKSASAKDILREFRPVNYIAYREDCQFDVAAIADILDSKTVSMMEYKELTRLYLINLIFYTTDGCRFDWMKYYVCFERDFDTCYNRIKASDQPLLLQSFNEWYLYYEGKAWHVGDIATAFIGWIQFIRDKHNRKLHHSVDISPIIDQLFISEDVDMSPEESDVEIEDFSAWL